MMSEQMDDHWTITVCDHCGVHLDRWRGVHNCPRCGEPFHPVEVRVRVDDAAVVPPDDASLLLVEQDYREAVQRAEALRVLRNELVRHALAAGWTHARIAEATGLTRGRIGQLAQQR